ncbi:hypothetical protein NN561_014086 [Cricetulus griseus]
MTSAGLGHFHKGSLADRGPTSSWETAGRDKHQRQRREDEAGLPAVPDFRRPQRKPPAPLRHVRRTVRRAGEAPSPSSRVPAFGRIPGPRASRSRCPRPAWFSRMQVVERVC